MPSGTFEWSHVVQTPEGPEDEELFVEYSFNPPIPATYWDPPEGGDFEELTVRNGLGEIVQLTQKEIDDLEQAIIDSYSGDFYERPYDEDYYRDRD
jgi:hypothetical protein